MGVFQKRNVFFSLGQLNFKRDWEARLQAKPKCNTCRKNCKRYYPILYATSPPSPDFF